MGMHHSTQSLFPPREYQNKVRIVEELLHEYFHTTSDKGVLSVEYHFSDEDLSGLPSKEVMFIINLLQFMTYV